MRGNVHIKKRELPPDKKYQSAVVSKVINMVMLNGKKTVAEKIVYGALDQSSKELKREPLEILDQVLKNVGPLLEIRSRRIGGANYQVPMEVKPERRMALALRWTIGAARSKQGKSMDKFLAEEFVEAYKGKGAAIKRRDETHRMAEANRAFAHFARY